VAAGDAASSNAPLTCDHSTASLDGDRPLLDESTTSPNTQYLGNQAKLQTAPERTLHPLVTLTAQRKYDRVSCQKAR
jgi:hypothetical protein